MLPCWCLVWLEYSIQKREEQSCTLGPNQWLEPKSIKQVPYLELGSIDFTSRSANQSMKKFHQDAPEHEPVEESESVEASNRIQPPDEADIVQLFEKFLSSKKFLLYCNY